MIHVLMISQSRDPVNTHKLCPWVLEIIDCFFQVFKFELLKSNALLCCNV